VVATPGSSTAALIVTVAVIALVDLARKHMAVNVAGEIVSIE